MMRREMTARISPTSRLSQDTWDRGSEGTSYPRGCWSRRQPSMRSSCWKEIWARSNRERMLSDQWKIHKEKVDMQKDWWREEAEDRKHFSRQWAKLFLLRSAWHRYLEEQVLLFLKHSTATQVKASRFLMIPPQAHLLQTDPGERFKQWKSFHLMSDLQLLYNSLKIHN